MRLASRLLPALIVLLALAPLGRPAEPPEGLKGRLADRDGVETLELWGTPRERGYAHGWLLAERIVRGLSTDLRALLGERAAATVARLGPVAAHGLSFRPQEEEELQGLLEGIQARLPAAERRIDLLDREITLLDLKLVNAVGDWYALGCSSAALWGGATGPSPVVVRNFDFPALDLLATRPHVRIVAPLPGENRRRGWVGVSHPGCIGTLTVMNEEGVFVSIHDVGVKPGIKDLLQPNVPRLVALRRLAEDLAAEGAVERARDLLRSWNTLYGNNLMVATPRPGDGLPAGVLEYDTREEQDSGATLRGPDPIAEGSTELRPSVVCSNHHRARAAATGCRRYAALVEGCQAPHEGRWSVPDLLALADRAAVPPAGRTVPAGGFGTLHQAVALTGEARLWLRFLTPGSNIRDAKPVPFDVAKLVAAAARGTGGD